MNWLIHSSVYYLLSTYHVSDTMLNVSSIKAGGYSLCPRRIHNPETSEQSVTTMWVRNTKVEQYLSQYLISWEDIHSLREISLYLSRFLTMYLVEGEHSLKNQRNLDSDPSFHFDELWIRSQSSPLSEPVSHLQSVIDDTSPTHLTRSL